MGIAQQPDGRPERHLQRLHILFFLTAPSPRSSTPFPYTTLFRSETRSRRSRPTIVLPPVQRKMKIKNLSRSEEHTSELQSRFELVCRLLLEKKLPQGVHIRERYDLASRPHAAGALGAPLASSRQL